MVVPLLAALAATLAVAWCLFAIAPVGPGIVLLTIVIWFALPGVLIAWLLYERRPGRAGAAWLVGPMWGYAASSTALLGLWVAGLRGPVLLLAPAIAASVGSVLAWPLVGSLSPPRFGRRDVVAACVLVALVSAIVGRPFARVGEILPAGKAYRAYFTADFVWRMAVAAELAKGESPPRNPYLRGESLRYYWLAHLLPAAEYRDIRGRASLEQLLLVNSLALGIGFVLFLYGFARQWVDEPFAVQAGCAITLLCPSFEGAERLFYIWHTHQPLDLLRTLNIDAVTRWFYASLPVDGLHRLLWYQPHHGTGYALGLSCVLVLTQARRPVGAGLIAFCGTLLGMCVLLSSFAAIMLAATTALVAAAIVVAARDWRALVTWTLAGAVPLALSLAVAIQLGYVDREAGNLVHLLVNPIAATNSVISIVLSFGPVLIPSLIAIVFAMHRRAVALWPLGTIILVSWFFYFFVDIEDHQGVYVGWRAGHILFTAFAVLTAYAIQESARLGTRGRRGVLAMIGIAAALGVPTFAIDLYNTQDLSNVEEAAGFKWTLILTPDELRALDWIRGHTPPDAIVQVEPFVRDAYTWAYVPAFAERRMAAGLPISMVPLRDYRRASRKVRSIFATLDPQEGYTTAAGLGIDYLWIGAPERQAFPELEQRLLTRPDLFRPIFSAGTVTIFFIERRPSG